jgi:hypothetical protein
LGVSPPLQAGAGLAGCNRYAYNGTRSMP